MEPEQEEKIEYKPISLESIAYFIKDEQKDMQNPKTNIEEDMLTIDMEEPHSRAILHRISADNILPDLYELDINHLDTQNDDLVALLSRHENKLDGLYFNYKASSSYRKLSYIF